MYADSLPRPKFPTSPASRPSLAAAPDPYKPTPHAASWVRGLRGVLAGLTAGMRRARVRRETIATLSDLDDRILADIGLERQRIGEVVEAVLRAEATKAPATRPAANDNEPGAVDAFEAVLRRWRARGASGPQP